MLKFDLGLFDSGFLLNMLDYGFDITKSNYESSIEGKLLKGKYKDYYFSFALGEEVENEKGNWEQLVANRAAFRVRDRMNEFDRMDCVLWLEKFLDGKYHA